MSTGSQDIAEPREHHLRGDLMELTRVRLNFMVVLTTGIGFLLAVDTSPFPLALFAWAVVGTALVAAGSSALNQVMEREGDSRMPRTADRPLPTGRMTSGTAFVIGSGLSLLGLGMLAWQVNLLTCVLALGTLLSYLFLYTPLKRRSSLATIIGAVPGAIPPMMGWTAVRGTIDLGAWALFGILFFWQLPHFLAIAWVYRDDYERGGMPMLTVVDREGFITARQMILYCAVLIPVSLLTTVAGVTGVLYLIAAILLGLAYLWPCFTFAKYRDVPHAKRLMIASVLYLPALLGAMLIDRLLL
ncbi:MAG: heme o synthase [Acidobacteriota bacterium]